MADVGTYAALRGIQDLTAAELRELEGFYATFRDPLAPPSDAELAVQLTRQDAEARERISRDRAVALRFQGEDEAELERELRRARNEADTDALQRIPGELRVEYLAIPALNRPHATESLVCLPDEIWV